MSKHELVTPRRRTYKKVTKIAIASFLAGLVLGLSVNVNWQDIFYAAYYFCGVG